MFQKTEYRGFTLIELLVVISIIGMLASITLVALQGTKDKAYIGAGQTQSSSIYQNFGTTAIGIWNIDEGAGNFTKNSVTNSYDTISMVGLSWVPGVTKNALHFTGLPSNGGIDITNTPSLPLFTLTAWVKNEVGGDQRHSILDPFWEIVDDNQICFYSYNFANLYWRCSGAGTVPSGKWVFLATSWDGSVIRHYANGKMIWKDTAVSSGSNEPFSSIGLGCCGNLRQFKGDIDEVRIYSQALGVASIEKLYAETLSRHDYASKYTTNTQNRQI